MASTAGITTFLIQLIASKLGVERSEINVKRPFFSIGVSSLISEEILASLAGSFENLSSTLLFEYPSVERLSNYLASMMPIQGSPVQIYLETVAPADAAVGLDNMPPTNTTFKKSIGISTLEPAASTAEDIAIIGIAGKFPKAASPYELWRNLLAKTDCVSEIPEKRWKAQDLYRHLEKNGLAISGKWGGFIDDIEYFDPLFFQIPHREAEIMDPQQKLFLQCGWELMEDAGYANSDFRSTDKIGVFVGVTWNEFSVLARDESLRDADYKGAGSLYWSIPNRLSYFLNLTGPSVAIDTACSSSLVAIHDACQAIKSGDCDMAIAGGINLNLHPAKYQFLTQNHFLSSDGRCKSFGEGGDGYVPSEGVAAVLLKPLSAALADGDQIYGLVKGTATNHGGRVTGYTVPNPVAHSEVISKAMERAGFSTDTISYVECHGTGTDLGDPIEIAGLSGVFDKAGARRNFCAIGSLKSNIGHLEAAAGVAGLIKILLSMRARQLPASLYSEKENKKLKLSESPFRLVKDTESWGQNGEVLRAGISSFGAGGSNAHVILESFSRKDSDRPATGGLPQFFVLSADSEPQLRQYAEKFLEFLQQIQDRSRAQFLLRDICFSMLAGRAHFRQRLVVQAHVLEDIETGLAHYLGQIPGAGEGKSLKVFIGQTSFESDRKFKSRHKSWESFGAAWAQAWVKGEADIRDLLDNFSGKAGGRRVSLPTYPFLKERSWLREGYPLVPLLEGLADAQRIHPLIDINTSSIYTQSFAKTFDVAEFVLNDHLVNDVHVIPGVCHLEMARVSAEHTLLDKVVEVKDVWFSNVISVRGKRRVEVQLQVDGSDLTYRIWDPENESVFSRGKISWPDAEVPDQAAEPIPLVQIRGDMRDEWPITDVYQKFIETGIIQKQSFQVLRSMRFNGDHALAELVLPENLTEDFPRFGFHPALMDGIVQTAMMHVQFLAGKDIRILPFHFSSVKLLKPLEREVFVHSRALDAGKMQFDLTLCNHAGEPLVKVTNFILREMKAETAYEEQTRKHHPVREELSQQESGSLYYTAQWHKTGTGDFALWEKAADKRSLLVINPRAEDEQAVTARFPGAVLVSHAGASSKDGNRFSLDTADFNQIQRLVQELANNKRLPQVIVYCAEPEKPAATCGEVLFLLAKALITKTQNLHFVVFAAQPESHHRSLLEAATGFFRTLSVEKPGFSGRVITLDRSLPDTATLLGCALSDISLNPSALDVRYQGEQREEKQFVQVAAQDWQHGAQVELRTGGCYLITGGMGGIGLIFARHLLREYQATVFLTGRSPVSERIQAELQILNGLGGSANYLPCDVTDLADVERAVAQILQLTGKLSGILHSAGMIDDGFILRKEPASFRKVIAPKVQGTLNLDSATAEVGLDFFCLFSSVTAILGNLGQCDYGYANAFEDSFSGFRNLRVRAGERSGKSLAINWPYWKNGGMQLSAKEEEILTKTFGFVPLQDEQGLKALTDGLASAYDQLAVLDGDHQTIQRMLGARAPEAGAAATANPAAAINGPADEAAQVKANATQYLKALFAKELKIPPERIDSKSSFERYGFDSIVMIDLINLMEKKFQSLPKTLFFEYQTLDQLADYFAAQHATHFRIQAEPGELVRKPAAETAASTTAVPQSLISALPSPDSVQQKAGSRFIAAAQAVQKSAPVLVTQAPLKRGVYDGAIAIVGLAGRYPEADNVDALWQNLMTGRDSVREVPASLWDWQEFYRPGKAQPAKSYSKWGGFLDNVDQFDARYFNISPKEAETMDPQERLFLQVATHAIQDAGYTAATLARPAAGAAENPVGVFVGVMWGDYQLYGVQSSDPAQWKTPRSFYWAIANRLSYFYNFSGPSMAIDTACSSSLTALHLACESLRRGEINAAIAGGVNLTMHPNKYNLLSEMQFLSSDGRCRSFGEGGDGYVPGDGVGAVVLKRLVDAEADGDHIYAVVRGTSINHGGKTSGFTVPNPHRQAALIGDALRNAGVNPRHVSYVEAHGTGTSLGDPVEMIGLQKAYAQQDRGYCAIGSIKSNIGHLEAAAGIAALTKVLLQFKHGKIAPSIHSETLNSHINFDSTPFRVQREPGDWPRPRFRQEQGSDALVEIPRIAGISSFGAGGSNAHAVLEEYIPAALPVQSAADLERAFVLSAHTPAALRNSAGLLRSVLENSHADLAAVACTLQLGREPLSERLAILASDRESLHSALDDFAQGRSNPNCLSGSLRGEGALGHLFGNTEDIQPLLDKWLAKGALRSLAGAWVAGAPISWEKLYTGHLPGRVPLPGYPFETRRYWTALPAAGQGSALHPLIDVNRSGFERVVFAKTYSPEEPLVAQHRVFGKATLPGAAQLAMAAQSLVLAQNLDTQALEFSHVFWEKPVQVTEQPVAVECELVYAEDGFVFEVGFESDALSASRIPCVQGRMRVQADQEPQVVMAPADRAGAEFAAAALHDAFNRMDGLAFGESFQCFESAWVRPDGVTARIRLSDADRSAATQLPPVALDAALRTSLLVGALSGQSLQLRSQIPVALERLRLQQPLAGAFIDVVARAATGVAEREHNRFDLDIYSDTGVRLLEIRGLTTRVIDSQPAAAEASPSTTVRQPWATDVEKVESWLRRLVAETTKLEVTEIDAELALEKYGIDSVMVMALNEKLEKVFGGLSKTLFFEYQNLKALTGYFCEHHLDAVRTRVPEAPLPKAARAPVATAALTPPRSAASRFVDLTTLRGKRPMAPLTRRKAVAVIGVSGRYPMAASLQEFWRNLLEGRDCIEEIPGARWSAADQYEAGTLEAGKSSGKWGGFIDGHDRFDAPLFKILPEQAAKMDPQERLFLQTVWSTLEDAGYAPAAFSRADIQRNVGVFAGSMWNHYSHFGLENTALGQADVTYGWDASIANRVSYFFDFNGPSMMVDTACSSSLLAIHQACESLLKGECRYAIAGGVNLSIHPYKYATLTQMQMLSSDGRCKSFGEGGDGYVPGEGVGAVLLKPLAQAVADGDHIYGVIRGSAANHNGKTNGFTVPNPVAQEAGIRLALEDAGLRPADISYVEAHGTGTRLGDPIEFNALNNVFRGAESPSVPCAVGSVKSNIGHLEGAAGIVALTKVLLQLQHRRLVPSLHSRQLNPNLNTAGSALYIPQAVAPWEGRDQSPRRAAIASLGAGGANAFLVVEEHLPTADGGQRDLTGNQLILLSARSLKSLRGNIQGLLQRLNAPEPPRLADLAFTLQAGRTHLEHRVALLVNSVAQLTENLRDLLSRFADGQLRPGGNFFYAHFEKAADRAWWPGEAASLISLAGRPLADIARAWILGELDDRLCNWKTLHQGYDPARIPLPTYAFDEQRYWAEAAPALRSGAAVTPLLDENLSSFHWQYYRKTFRAGDAIVAHHRVAGNTVIAGSVLLEMALTAAQNAVDLLKRDTAESLPLVRVQNLHWRHAAVVEQEPVAIGVLLLPAEQGAHFALLPAAVADGIRQRTLEAGAAQQATFISGDLTFAEGRPLQRRNLDMLLARLQPLAERKADIYQYYRNLGLDYGDYFQVTESVHVGEKRALAILSGSEGVYDFAGQCLSPAIADGALRTALLAITSGQFSGVAALAWSQLLVPHSIECLSIHATLPQRVFCLIELLDVDAEFQTFAELDITLMDARGHVCAELKRFRAVAPSADFYARASQLSAPALKTHLPESSRKPPSVQQSENAVANHSARDLETALQKFLRDAFTRATGIASGDIQFAQTFDAIGVDSITIVKLNRLLDARFNKLSKTLFFECRSLADVQSYLLRKHLDEVAVFAGGPPVAPLAAAETVRETAAPAYEAVYLQAQRQPSPAGSVPVNGNTRILLLGNLPDSVSGQLPFQVIRATHDNQFAEQDAQNYRIDTRSAAHFGQLFENLAAAAGMPDIICLADTQWLDVTVADQGRLTAAIEEVTTVLLNLIRALSHRPAKPVRILACYRSFGANRQPQWDALEGLAHSLKDISDHVRLSLVRLHPALAQDRSRLVECLIDECASPGEQSCMLEYDARGRRHHYVLQETSGRFSERAALPVQDGGIYLISGGAGAIGSAMARYMAGRAAAESRSVHLVLLGRSQANARIETLVASLVSAHCAADYLALDIQDAAAVDSAVAKLAQRGPVRGVLHCAGVSADTALLQADYQQFSRPLGAKCAGTVNLDLATARQPLDFFVLFSSITTQIGDFGAGGYSYANAFQDNFAHLRNFLYQKRQRHGRTLSIGWPLWDIEGLQQDEDLVETYLQAYGLGRISTHLGLEVLEKSWSQGCAQVAVYYGERQRIRERILQPAYRAATVHTAAQIDSRVRPAATESRLTRALTHYQRNPIWNAAAARIEGDIAIIGIAGRYPQAADLESFWKNLCEGRDCITEVPAQRWDYRQKFSSNREDKARIYGKWGGFIDDVDLFDAQYFNISPREAELLDPQERIFLQAALHCLDDAGYTRETLAQATVGVYAGVMWAQYQLFDVSEEQQQSGLPGSSFSAIANRVSYSFDFSGPSMALDTMCSSSLTALHTARLAILNGECDYALAGGVNLSLHEKKYQLLSQGQFLSSDGRCRTFGAGGDGYVPGEGVGVVLLKRLEKAIEDGDQIYAVLKSSAVNHGGRANGFTVPNPRAQGNVIARAIHQAGWNPETISYLEAHGTGTSLGDPIEITGLQNAFEAHTANKQFCVIGSVKSNIGHLESAAGMAGLTKVLLQLKNRQLVPSLHSGTPNPNIDFAATAFRVATQLTDWQRPVIDRDGERVEFPLRAGVSSFGAGGSNAHILIEEFCPPDGLRPSPDPAPSQENLLFIFSARSAQRLAAQLVSFSEFCSRNHSARLAQLRNIAFTLMVGREQAAERVAILANSLNDLGEKLQVAIAGKKGDDIFHGRESSYAQLDKVMTADQRRDLLEDFVLRRDLGGLAGAWVSGITIDWPAISRRLFKSGQVCRVSLPATPLLPVRFWVHQVEPQALRPAVPYLHPLLDKNESTLFQQAYTKEFSGAEFYLADHVIGIDKPRHLLPGAAYIEMVRAAAAHALAGRSTVQGLRDLVWQKPIAEDQFGKQVRVLLGESDGRLGFEVVSAAGESMDTHARGSLILDAGSDAGGYFDLAAEWPVFEREYGAEDISRYFKGIGYHDGESFLAAQQIRCSAARAISRLVLPAHLLSQAAEFQLHPSLMDAALRTCLFIGGTQGRFSTLVPFSVDEVVIFDALPGECYAVAELVSDAQAQDASLRRYDLVVVDPQGRRRVAIRGFSAREIFSGTETHLVRRQWRRSPADLAGAAHPHSPVLILGPGAKAFADRAGFATGNCITLDIGEGFSREPYGFVIRRNHSEDLESVLQMLHERGELPDRLLLLAGFDQDATLIGQLRAEAGVVDQGLRHSVIPLVVLFKALNRLALTRPVRTLCTYALGDQASPLLTALSAFAKSMVQVNHKIEIGCVGVDLVTPQIAPLLERELTDKTFRSGIEVQYREGRRWINQFERLDEQSADGAELIIAGGTYLITGGAGQLGQIFARLILDHERTRVILTGRSPADDRILALLQGLGVTSDRLMYLPADISRAESLAELMAAIGATFGEIRAIFHCAGVVDTRTITDLDEFGFRQTLEPKVHGLVNLYELAKTNNIGDLVCFSSVSSFLGDFGGGSYAYANRFMDAFTDNMASVQGAPRVRSIGWPLWLDGGMQLPEEQQAFYRHTGIHPITEEQGLAAFRQILSVGPGAVAVCAGPWDKIARTLQIAQSPAPPRTSAEAALVVAPVIAVAAKPAVAADTTKGGALDRALLAFLQNETGAVLKMEPAQIDPASRFESFGMDSVMLMELNRKLNRKFQDLPKTTLFEYDSIARLHAHLQQRYAHSLSDLFGDAVAAAGDSATPAIAQLPATTEIAQNPVTSPLAVPTGFNKAGMKLSAAAAGLRSSGRAAGDSRIAVIGMSATFPESDDLESFWRNVLEARNCLREIPEERWPAAQYFSSSDSPFDGTRARSKWGGFISRVHHFDAGFFKMSDQEAAALDPQLRLMLKAAWLAVEDAAYAASSLRHIPFGVYVGVMNSDYAWIAADVYQRSGRYPGPGSFASEIANRISYILNVTGPSLTVETACASSSTAVHLARKAILNGECEMALAGGVNLSLHPGKYLMLDQMKVLSPDGVEKTFDADANGLVPSEGVGAVVLKSYAKAVADGDYIYGVISGSAVGHSGVGPALNLPSVQAMEKTIAAAIDEAGISGEALGYIESHGTGTELGDPIELKALVNALRRYGVQQEYCAVGSKANFGHLESASGVCSLIKVLLAFKHGTIPPCGNIRELTPAFDRSASPLYFPAAATAFDLRASGRRYAGINSFGLGGSNAFLVLESHEAVAPAAPGNNPQALIFSAPTRTQLRDYMLNFVGFCERHPKLDLAAAAFSLQVGRQHFQERLALVAEQAAEVAALAKRWLEGERNVPGCFTGNLQSGRGLAELLSGAEGEAFISSSLNSGNLHKLCELWVSGGQIPWQELHAGAGRRCPLPTYRFVEKEHSLRLTSPAQPAAFAKPLPEAPRQAEPLPEGWYKAVDELAQEIVEKPAAALRAEQILTKAQLRQLRDLEHVVVMTPVQQNTFKRFVDTACTNQIKQVVLTLDGDLEELQLMNAWLAVAAKASVLRSVFISTRKGYFRAVLKSADHPLLRQCFRSTTAVESLQAELDLARNAFDLSRLVPYEVRLCRTGDASATLKTHIVWSFPEYLMHTNDAIGVLRKLHLAMTGSPTLAEIRSDANLMRNLDLVDCEESVKDYWLKHLKEHSAAKPFAVRNGDCGGEREYLTAVINTNLTRKLQELTQREKIEFDAVLAAAWAVIQARLTGSSHAMFAFSGKFKSFETEDFLSGCGIYESRVPMLINTQVRGSTREWLLEVQTRINEKRKYAHIPFETIQHWMDVPSLACCTLSVKDLSVPAAVSGEHKAGEFLVRENYDTPLALIASLSEQKINLTLEFFKSQFDRQQAERVLQYLEVVFESIVANSNRNPAAIALMTKEEYRQRFWKTLDREGA